MRTIEITSVIVTALMLCAGCSVYRNYQPQNPEITDGLFGQEYGELAEADTTTIAAVRWDDFFTDAPLRELIYTALKNNADINIARERVIEAQASLKAAGWAFFPSLSLGPSANFYSSQMRYGGSAQSYSVPANASWEVDLSGKLRNRRRKAAAALEQSEAYVRSLQTEIVATVAEYYFTLLKLDSQLEISRTTSSNWAENVRIMKAMKEAGMTNEASVSQTEANACSIEASLFDLEYQVKECENALCTFIGILPQKIERSSLSGIDIPFDLKYGVPAQLLSYREDVKRAELDLKQAFYDTAIAKAAFYPSINITGSSNWEKSVSSPAGWLISLGAGLTQPLLARGTLKADLTIARARQEEAALAFRQVLLKAGTEVCNALAICESARGKTDVRLRQIAALESAVVSTRELMRLSESTYLEVLTAQQSLLSARLQQVSDRYDLLKGTVSLYRALGGGSE